LIQHATGIRSRYPNDMRQHVHRQRSQLTVDRPLEFAMRITIMYTNLGRIRATIQRPAGALDRSNYGSLIVQALAARADGAGHLIVDMSDVEHVGTAGLVGIYAVARLAQGARPPSLEAGWAAIRALAEDPPPVCRLAVVNPRPLVRQALARALFAEVLDIHADVDAALAALAAWQRPACADKPLSHKGASI
jgi:hypothetical protein